jgi:hypothetical protein
MARAMLVPCFADLSGCACKEISSNEIRIAGQRGHLPPCHIQCIGIEVAADEPPDPPPSERFQKASVAAGRIHHRIAGLPCHPCPRESRLRPARYKRHRGISWTHG